MAFHWCYKIYPMSSDYVAAIKSFAKSDPLLLNYVYSRLGFIMPPTIEGEWRGGYIAFGANPFGVGVGVSVSVGVCVRVAHFLHSLSWTNGWILTKFAHTRYWEGGKKCLDFGVLDLIYKIFKFDQKKLVCTLTLEPNYWFWSNFIHCNIGKV